MAIVNVVISKKHKRAIYRKLARDLNSDRPDMTTKQLNCHVWHKINKYDLKYRGWMNQMIPDALFLSLVNINNSVYHRSLESRRKLTFEQCVCETITHEEIHIWLRMNEDSHTCSRYDRIYRKNRLFGVMA